MNTWNNVRAEIAEIVRADCVSGEIDPHDSEMVREYAETWADGSEYVIYYSKARELWMDSTEVSDFEEEARELGPANIDTWIGTCVYLAMVAEICEQAAEIAEEDNEATE